MLVIATARNKHELNRELLTSQGTHTFDRVLEIEPPTLVSGNWAPTLSPIASMLFLDTVTHSRITERISLELFCRGKAYLPFLMAI